MSLNKGGRVCAVPGCGNWQGDHNEAKKLTFHVIPKDEKVRQLWLRLLKNNNISKWSRVCSEHFQEDDYCRTLVKGEYWYSGSLKREAIPSLKLPISKDECHQIRIKRQAMLSSQVKHKSIPSMTAPLKSYSSISNGDDPRDYFSKVKTGTKMDSLGSQIILNVFSQLTRLDPRKSLQALAEETSKLTGVECNTVFELKAQRTRLRAAYVERRHSESNQKSLKKDSRGSHWNLPPGSNEFSNANPIVPTSVNWYKPPIDVAKSNKREQRPLPGHVRKRRQSSPSPDHGIGKYDEIVLTGIRLKVNEYLGRDELTSFWGFWREVIADDELPNFPRNEFVALMNDMGLAAHFGQLDQPARPLSRRNKKKKLEPDFDYGD